MATYQVPAPAHFNFRQPEEWCKWLHRFEYFRQASDLSDEKQVKALVYAMGDEADDSLNHFVYQKVIRQSTRPLKRNLTSIS